MYVVFSPLKHVTYLNYEITPRDRYFPQDNIYSKQIKFFLTNEKNKIQAEK